MVKYDPKNWWGLIFQFHKSDTFRRLIWVMLSIAAFSAINAYITHEIVGKEHYEGTTVFHSLLGFVISLLLVFRTNTAYDRWWEGRKLWGALVNLSRTFSLKIKTYLGDGENDQDRKSIERLCFLIAEYPSVLKEHLKHKKVKELFPENVHQPNYIATKMMEEINRLHQEGKLNDMQFLTLNDEITKYQDICGACERILKTPIPYSYSLFIKKFIFIYIISMPFALSAEFHYWTTLIVPFVFYVFASLELIAESIEDPFGDDSDDLPTGALAENMRNNVNEIFDGFNKKDDES